MSFVLNFIPQKSPNYVWSPTSLDILEFSLDEIVIQGNTKSHFHLMDDIPNDITIDDFTRDVKMTAFYLENCEVIKDMWEFKDNMVVRTMNIKCIMSINEEWYKL